MSFVNKKGVDISEFQGDIDLAKVKKAGYEFVIIRIGQGTRITDSYFAKNVTKAEKIGMPWGAYLLTEATTTAQANAEVAFADKMLKAQIAKGYKPTFPIAIDIEEDGFSSKDYTPAILTNTAKTWVNGIKKLGYYPMIYTGYYDIRDYISSSVVKSCDIWLAEYGRYPDYTESNLGIWQYGGETNLIESNSIAGVGVIDKDKCYKDYPTIIQNGGYNGWKKSGGSTNGVTASTIINKAKSQIGVNATPVKKCKYNTWFYGAEVSGTEYDWCEVFVQWVFNECKASSLLYEKTANCGTQGVAFENHDRLIIPKSITSGLSTKDVKAGDVVLFHWSTEKSTWIPGTYVSDHVGIIEKVNSDGTITTIEGNTGTTNGSVMRRVRSMDVVSCVGRPAYSGSTPTPTPTPTVKPKMLYRVRVGGKWQREVNDLTSYAGIVGKPITDIAIKATKGKVKYRVHIKGGDWLPYVTGYNTSDDENGYAGDKKAIDAIEIYYTTPSDIVSSQGYYKAKYRVSPVNQGYYDWQYDDETTDGQDGYAGSFGKTIDRVQITLSN